VPLSDAALNADVVLPRLVPEYSQGLDSPAAQAAGNGNLMIEGDNFHSLRMLKSTHVHRVRVIYIDPPYNTGNKDWVYNDRYVGAKHRWRHSQWLEFLPPPATGQGTADARRRDCAATARTCFIPASWCA